MKKLYDWVKIFKKERTILRKGMDYFCSQSAMSQQIRTAASVRGLSVSIRDTGVALVIDVEKEVCHGKSA